MRSPAFLTALLVIAFAVLSSYPRVSAAQTSSPPLVFETSKIAAPYAPLVETNTAITLPEAIGYALSYNSEIAIARREYEATEGGVIQGQTRPNPTLSFVQEDLRSIARSSTLQVNFPVERGGKRQARIDVSQRARDVARAELGLLQGEVRAAVTGAFFDVLAAQERISLALDTLTLTQRVTDLTAKRVSAGKISPVEETKARVAEAQVKVELLQAQGELRASRQRLAALWGNVSPKFERVDGASLDLPEVPAVATLEQRVEVSANLRRNEVELMRRSALTRVEQSKRTPDPTISVGIKNAAGIGSQILLGISLPLQVFDNNRGNMIEAFRREDKARDEVTASRLRLQSEALQGRERLISARSEVDVLRSEVLPGAQSAFAAASRGFDAGKFSFLETLDAQRTLIQARSQYLRAIAESHRAAVDIERLLGVVFEEQYQ